MAKGQKTTRHDAPFYDGGNGRLLVLRTKYEYYEGLAYFLYQQEGYFVHIVLPNKAYRFAQSLGLKSSTDKIDSRMLAQFGLERELWRWQPISADLLGLRQLTREREALVRTKIIAANQLHAYNHQGKPNKAVIARSKKHISFIDSQVKQIEKEIKKFVDNDKEVKRKIDFLDSIPGIGVITAAIIVAETNGFASIESIKQLTSYVGLDVKIAESGKWKGKSTISKRGNSYIRKALYTCALHEVRGMPSLSNIRKDKKAKQFYERLKEKKGIGMVAVVACMRKLLGLMYTLWKKEEMYKENGD